MSTDVTLAGIGWLKFTTIVLFVSFILMIILLCWPYRNKPYKDAEKIVLKEDNDAPIHPRQTQKNHERTK